MGTTRCLMIDEGIANHQRCRRRRTRPCHQRLQPRRIGLARQRPIAGNDVVEQVAQAERFQDLLGRSKGLVGEHRQARMATRIGHDAGHPVVRNGVIQQASVIDLHESIERAGRIAEARGGKRTAYEHARALTNHAPDGVD